MSHPSKIPIEYWENFGISNTDLEFLYNHLLEIEIPQTTQQLIEDIVETRIINIKDQQSKEQILAGTVYLPKNTYTIGESLIFSALEWKKGEVENFRAGFNPEFGDINIIDVEIEDGRKMSFACNLDEHPLNNPENLNKNDPLLDSGYIFTTYGEILVKKLKDSLEKNDDLVQIAGKWFPKSLLLDIHTGHLNLIEAVLEESEGGPLSTRQLIDRIDLEVDSNKQLTEFSLDFALQNDSRFDEVGPAGETYWYLKSMEPIEVIKPPIFLQFNDIPYDKSSIIGFLQQFEGDLFDELEEWEKNEGEKDFLDVSLIYPHWRSGTLPLSYSLSRFFPTAYEAPRVRFTFVDGISKAHFPGWVVRSSKYVYGLRNWYESNGLISGSIVHLRKGENPGEIIVTSERCRQSREWMRTALIGIDQKIVFGMLKQSITTTYNERMAIVVPDPNGLDELWKKNICKNEDLSHTIFRIMHELIKLNPQIHAQELYASVNIVRRCPPGLILIFLTTNKDIKHLGDLYFQISESGGDK